MCLRLDFFFYCASKVSGQAIQSEVCVVLDANFIMSVGSNYAHVLHVTSNSTKLSCSLAELPPTWKGSVENESCFFFLSI